MKKIVIILSATFLALQLMAQVPQAISYQTVVRNANNNLLVNTPVSIKISILLGVTTVYSETHSKTTNENGLVSLSIGKGSVISGAFSAIDWSTGTYSIKTEIDPFGGTNYTITGTSQLLSVPYAFHSASTSDQSAWLKNIDDLYYTKGNIGIKNSNPKYPLHVNGNIYLQNRGNKLIFGANGGLPDSIFAISRPLGTDGILVEANDIDLRSRVTRILLASPKSVNIANLEGTTSLTVNTLTGRVGIGTSTPTQLLTVNGTIESIAGGFKFPDGTLQTTAATPSPWTVSGNSINYAGNVGIGVTNPLAKLELDGNIQFKNLEQGLIFGQNDISIKSVVANNSLELKANAITFKATSPAPSVLTPVQFLTNSPVQIKDYFGTTKMTFDPMTGNTGLGTQVPARTLHVKDVMRLEPIATPPTLASKGDIYFDSTINKLRVYDGTTWQNCW